MESFKPIIFEDGDTSAKYTVSNFGRVLNTVTGKFVSQSVTGPDGSNYFCVNLNEPNKKRVSRKVHVLVARAWLKLDDYTGLEVDHIDINRFNNSLYNLRWVTRTENMNNRNQENTIIITNILITCWIICIVKRHTKIQYSL